MYISYMFQYLSQVDLYLQLMFMNSLPKCSPHSLLEPFQVLRDLNLLSNNAMYVYSCLTS